ncbi:MULTISPECIES: response regulator transcription factor [unclassified Herbaspirillum]|uniref:response regulator transcription factor n=1 Tax=unclassified Herbaspirillum TaxID=2624150 RepID=UPI001153C62A|nr:MULTISPECIES: response regulator transcription factor [unclassified Herbaspirillum]MBB5390557.1 two-component system capsular synthesis response regulator RcsB [Herbaspirillum sp. SJZ102]TQK08955.1 LuxR family two component transcriptional regulator [Herbaspirillum sp. SJZ130]TQK14358.1 LuxR family two component transcriptional regulator [Herbaspirillum sp. SJZ106]TWC66625.1 LuxR family two component transcriptional regulator [Herbaspirillum sp. SJZ099]
MATVDSFRKKCIRVGVADDYPVVLRGVESMLETCDDIDLVFSAETVEQLFTKLGKDEVDVLLCDYIFENTPHVDGLNLLKKIRREAPEVRVIFFSSYIQPHSIFSSLEYGAAGFVGKEAASFACLHQAISTVHSGQTFVAPSLSTVLFSYLCGNKKDADFGATSLSPRELVVVRMISEGMPIRAIAEKLCRSRKTISNQKLAAMKKLGVKNDVELSRAYHSLYR